jgi:FkbM family methyltransferase
MSIKIHIKKMLNKHSSLRYLHTAINDLRRSGYRLISKTAQKSFWFDQIFGDAICGRLVVNVPSFEGDFEVDCRSDLLKRVIVHGDYETRNADIVNKHLESCRDAIDVGANVGFFSVLMRKRLMPSSRLLAIEPNSAPFELLQKNLTRNSADNGTILFNGVVSDRCGKSRIYFIEGREEYASIGEATQIRSEDSIETKEVPAATLDWLVETHQLNPGFIKVDTEGAEYLVFKGALKTLKEHRPVVLTELSDHYLKNFSHNSEDCPADLL